MIFALEFLAPLARLLVVVAFGQVRYTPTKLSEVDLAIMVFVQRLHGFLNVTCIDFTLKYSLCS